VTDTVERLLARLDGVEARLGSAVAADPPTGLTDPDPDTDERWEAGQVWAHIAEFVPYWQGQAEGVIGAAAPMPVPFGRVKTDPGRIAAIERERRTTPLGLMSRVSASIDAVRIFASELEPDEWRARGVHPTRGEMTVERIVERFIVEHLEEHADQLERLAASSA
jgi:hypothetical protein